MSIFKRTQRKYVKKAYRVRNWREYEAGLRNRGCAFYLFIRAPQLDRSPVYRDHACMISSLVRARPLAQPQTQTLSY